VNGAPFVLDEQVLNAASVRALLAGNGIYNTELGPKTWGQLKLHIKDQTGRAAIHPFAEQ
jgi:hypothetical protein